MSKKADNNLLRNVAGIAGILIVFVVILRATLTPLYQEVGQMERFQEQQLAQGAASNSGGNSGGSSSGSSSGSGENINIDLGNPGGWFNWALGWAWGGPGWYRGPDYGSWGANVWNGWRNWQGGNGNNRVWNGNVNDTRNREVNNEIRSDHSNIREDDRIRNSGGERREGGEVRENRDEPRKGGGGSHGGAAHGGESQVGRR